MSCDHPDVCLLALAQINLFQMLSLTAHRFALLIEMLPFANQTMAFFRGSVQHVLKKTARGIHRSLQRMSKSSGTELRSDGSNRSEGQAYKRLRHQVRLLRDLALLSLTRMKSLNAFVVASGIRHWPPLLLSCDRSEVSASVDARQLAVPGHGVAVAGLVTGA